MDTINSTIRELSPDYFITITYKSVPHVKPKIQLMITWDKLKRALNKSTEYIMVPELQISGNIHYHGLIKIVDMIKWFKHTLPWIKINCGPCVKVERIKSLENVYAYITKDISQNKIIFDEDNLFLTRDKKIKVPVKQTLLETIIELDDVLEGR